MSPISQESERKVKLQKKTKQNKKQKNTQKRTAIELKENDWTKREKVDETVEANTEHFTQPPVISQGFLNTQVEENCYLKQLPYK